MTHTVINDLWRKRLQYAVRHGMTNDFCKSQFGYDIAGLQEKAAAEEEREAVAGSADAATEAAKLRAAADAALSKANALVERTAERQLKRDTIRARISDLQATIPAIEKFIEDTLASQSSIAGALAEVWGDPDFVVRQASPMMLARYNATLARAVELPLELAAQRAALVLVQDRLKTAEAELTELDKG